MASLIYIYGPNGCGKSHTVKEILSGHVVYSDRVTATGSRVDWGSNFVVVDDATKRILPTVHNIMRKPEIKTIIMIGNVRPSVFGLLFDDEFDFTDHEDVSELKELLATSCS
jgi:ABC-type cobalamin/Fe3+-siderophores transport system ATPase subunit